MGFFEALYKIYPNCLKAAQQSEFKILPICHTKQKAQIEITIDGEGNFKNAELINNEKTIIPATEDSASRTSTSCYPHGLADKIQYVAKDYGYEQKYGDKESHFMGKWATNKKYYQKGYIEQLDDWCKSKFANDKILAVYNYVKKGTIVRDLVDKKILWVNSGNKLLTEAEKGKEEEQAIFKLLTKSKGKKDQGDAFIRWRVRSEDNSPQEETWNDEELRKSWIDFVKNDPENKSGYCSIEEKQTILSCKHPKNINPRASGAKLVSFNDFKNFTYRGRFQDAYQAFGISFDVSQKAHAVLKWLLDNDRKQAYFNDKEAYVVFRICDNSKRISINIGQIVGKQLIKMMRGYYKDISNDINDKTMILGFDAATEGRLSCVYYKDLQSSDFFKRIESWNERYKWKFAFNYSYMRKRARVNKNYEFIGAPSVDLISNIYFYKKGKYDIKKREIKIKKKIAKEILQCIIENKENVPKYISEHFFRRASNPEALDYNQWQKISSIACALYKGDNKKENLRMELEIQRPDRDYLYGRLLGVLHFYENEILSKQNSKRLTNAQRAMPHFVLKPFDAWNRLYSDFHSKGYRAKLKGDWFDEQIREIMRLFKDGEYEKNFPQLSGLFIAGFNLQIGKLKAEKEERILKQKEKKDNVNIEQQN
ncbi:MAG: type I-C CRISPR-associated protein Cas8c/Csd1 [Endomicrobium sp.]|jgi:CRISPR-associated protein Csd1|nr:type I-C CRISPR-associated protein Cas8c/Csd1 [Endomicrobium sp.]